MVERARLLAGRSRQPAGGPDAGQAHDMEPEFRFDRAEDFSLLHPEYGVLERFDHHAASDQSEVAALGRRARVLRMPPGELGEARREFARFGEQPFGFELRLRQDMARAPLLLDLVL